MTSNFLLVSSKLAAPLPSWTDEAGLRVQERMADIANQVLWLTWGQLIIGALGAVALVITLNESRKASSTALKALRVQQDAERALLVVSKKHISFENVAPTAKPWLVENFPEAPKYRVTASATVENRGKSVAQIKSAYATLFVGAELPDRPAPPPKLKSRRHAIVDVGTDIKVSIARTDFDGDASLKIQSGEHRCWIYGKVHYADLFGTPHELAFCYRATTPDKYGISEDGGDAYWANF